MPQYKHALVVIRDLRRNIGDMVMPGRHCSPERLQAIDELNGAIKKILNAERLCSVANLLEGAQSSLVTEALQQIDWFQTAAHRPRPVSPAELRTEE
jgi:hypothetical protein